MTIHDMRAALKQQYKGAYKWVNKVNKMSDMQVIAVYKRMQSTGQIKN